MRASNFIGWWRKPRKRCKEGRLRREGRKLIKGVLASKSPLWTSEATPLDMSGRQGRSHLSELGINPPTCWASEHWLHGHSVKLGKLGPGGGRIRKFSGDVDAGCTFGLCRLRQEGRSHRRAATASVAHG